MRRGTAGSSSRATLAVRASAYGIRSPGESSVKCSRIRMSLGLLDGSFWKAGGTIARTYLTITEHLVAFFFPNDTFLD